MFQLEVEMSVRADKLAPVGTEVKLQLEIIAGSSSTQTVTLKVSMISLLFCFFHTECQINTYVIFQIADLTDTNSPKSSYTQEDINLDM